MCVCVCVCVVITHIAIADVPQISGSDCGLDVDVVQETVRQHDVEGEKTTPGGEGGGNPDVDGKMAAMQFVASIFLGYMNNFYMLFFCLWNVFEIPLFKIYLKKQEWTLNFYPESGDWKYVFLKQGSV